jgi:hypothetical protein
LDVHDLEENVVEDEGFDKDEKDKEELVIPGTDTIANPRAMMIVHHDTRVANLTVSRSLRLNNLHYEWQVLYSRSKWSKACCA